MLKIRRPRQAVARAHQPASAFCIADDQTQRVTAVLERVAGSLHAGNVAGAERQLRDGLDRDPDHPRLQAYLTICLAAAGRDLRSAELLVRDLLDRNPQEAAGYYALGCIHLLAERRRPAFQAFERARRLGRGDRQLALELDRKEERRAPVFGSLPRGHFLNVFCGRMRARWQRLLRRSN